MSTYAGLLLLHVSSVVLSVIMYLHRGIRALVGQPIPRRSLLGILPHAVDTVLLSSAVALSITIHQYPFVAGWLTAKLIGLGLYVVLGTVAIRSERPLRIRWIAFALSLVVVAAIVETALHHSPLPSSWF